MNFKPEIFKQLLATFQSELEEGMHELINGLVALEKLNNDSAQRTIIIDKIFRIAHNLKGAARGLSINDVGEIAHHIESIFSMLKLSGQTVEPRVIDLCLEAVDKMGAAMQAFLTKSALTFDMSELVSLLTSITLTSGNEIINANKDDLPQKQSENFSKPVPTNEVSPLNDSIRVPLKVIDNLSALSEEIQASKIQLEDYSIFTKKLNRLMLDFSSAWNEVISSVAYSTVGGSDERLQNTLDHANDRLHDVTVAVQKVTSDIASQTNDYSRLSRAIHDEVALLRLVPVQNYLCLLPRYIRELSATLHKNTELTINGGDVYIDKYVLEGLKDPINHLLRNAIDHGVEDVKTRKMRGKPDIANITISVKDAGNKVYFEISDDGAGLDYERIRKKVKSFNSAYADNINALSEHDLQQYIFQPGFSTKDNISDISGRGIGLDVVKKNIQALKGSISIQSVFGAGTTFIVTVPLSISSERGVLIQCDEQIFVLPTANIDRIYSIPLNEIIHLEGNHAILIDGHPILLKSLSTVLDIHHHYNAVDNLTVLILQVAGNMVALSVDKIIGEREIVIKPIEEPLSVIKCVTGATLLDRNKIAIVLNPEELLRLSMHATTNYSAPVSTQDIQIKQAIKILVVDDSITTRTLEKNILEHRNYQVTTAVNGQDAWEILQKHDFSLVITDVNMPIMDGFELTERIKTSAALTKIPVIIVSSLGSDSDKARGVEVGADAYLVKTEFESGVLLQMIERLI